MAKMAKAKTTKAKPAKGTPARTYDPFAVFVVGDLRDGQAGFYRGFPAATAEAFALGGARLYNEAVLVTAVGSLPIRAARQFEIARKLGKTHQNVLVFCKGDPRKATQAIGPVEFGTAVAAEPAGAEEVPPPSGTPAPAEAAE